MFARGDDLGRRLGGGGDGHETKGGCDKERERAFHGDLRGWFGHRGWGLAEARSRIPEMCRVAWLGGIA